jgi:hypothetical protein
MAAAVQNLPDPGLDRAWAWGAYDSEGVRFALFRTYEELCELAVKTIEARRLQGLALSAAQQILAQYHAAYLDLQAALLGLPVDMVTKAPTEGEWSPRRVLAHIVGAEIGFYVVVRYALDRFRSGDGRPAEIPDEAWDEVLGEQIASVETILDGPLAGIQVYYEMLHGRILHEFAEISEEELAAPSMYWEGYELSLRFRLHRFDSHLRQHTIQIDKTLHALGTPPSEAKRILRLIYAALAQAEGARIGTRNVATDLWHTAAEAIDARAQEIAGVFAGGGLADRT